MFLENVMWFKTLLKPRNWFFISFSELSFAFWSSLEQSVTVVCLLELQICFDFVSQCSLASQGFLFHSNLCLVMRTKENSTNVPNTRRSDVKRCTPNLFNLDSFGLSAYKSEKLEYVTQLNLTVLSYNFKIQKLFHIFVQVMITIWWTKMLVRVRNWVTIIATLPGIAVIGMIKLEKDMVTIAIHGT